MTDILVRIMLHGLIALVPVQGGNGANHMTALLVDARQPPAVQCATAHRPRLTVVTSNQECVAAGCTASAQECICELDRQEVTLTPDVQPVSQALSKGPISSLPADRAAAADFGYVANLVSEPLGQTLDPRFLAPAPPSGLVARMSFPFESVKACSLSIRRDEEVDNVHPMSFRPLGVPEAPDEKSQAVAQMLMAHYRLPDPPGGPGLMLTLSDFGGGNAHSMVLKAGPEGYLIRLVNERPTLLPDDPCDDGVGRDFAFFYNLAQDPPAWQERKIPHVKFTQWKNAADLLDPECQGLKEPMSRPVCPIGSFHPAAQ